MILFYNLFRVVYFGGIQLAALQNRKAKLWVQGRKNWQTVLQQKFQPKPGDKIVWVHCASLGEFEQGRPVIEALKKKYPNCKVVLTFFSPSGYEIRKDYDGADVVMYMPPDSKQNAEAFINNVQPSLAVFVKYEFWHYYLSELQKRKIETILISGIFRNTQPFFQWWGGFYRKMLLRFSHLFVQDKASALLLASINIQKNVTVCGDTRFDRVLENAQHWQPIEEIEKFIQHTKKILVAGSTWKEDEEIIAEWLAENKNEWQLLIAPHEIDEAHISNLKKLLGNGVLFSEMSAANPPLSAPFCIINSIGQLSKLYKYATVCYIGGGFNKSGHHNILEAAVFGKPVITGPHFEKFKESSALKKLGASFTISNATQLKEIMLQHDISAAGTIAANYVSENSGATAAILNYIQEKRLFTNA